MIKVLDNFLSEDNHKKILTLLSGNKFNWFLSGSKYTVQEDYYKKAKDNYKNLYDYLHFGHIFYHWAHENKTNSEHYPLIDCILQTCLQKFNRNKITLLRAKANIQPRLPSTKKNHHNTPHTDTETPHHVFLYYKHYNNPKKFFLVASLLSYLI